jgi:hypothetical protein
MFTGKMFCYKLGFVWPLVLILQRQDEISAKMHFELLAMLLKVRICPLCSHSSPRRTLVALLMPKNKYDISDKLS